MLENDPRFLPDSSLVVLSNRLPYNLPAARDGGTPKRNVGGLVNAVEPALAARGGLWVGWDGSVLPNLAAIQSALESPRRWTSPAGVEFVGVPLSERELARYYHGFCNGSLWPLFHDFIGKVRYLPEEFALYERVNRRMAEAALAQAAPGARIWVHDFHLMLVPAILRELGFRGLINFFLHIPFPPGEIYRTLPWRERLLAGLLAADGVAFHHERYRENFVRTAQGLAPLDVVPVQGQVGLVGASGTSWVSVSPIGIDVEDFERLARDPAVLARSRRIRSAHGGRRLLLAADRLDYTKGIRKRLYALERLFDLRPDLVGRVDLVTVVVPSRHQVEEYRTLKRDVDREVGRINGERGEDGWLPIHYRYRALDRRELVAHYLAADVALVSPLRDGMNLVASEFVASRVDEDGALVLSEFAGVSDRLPGALLVNPYDVDGVAQTIARALDMGPQERQGRMAQMRRRVRSLTASSWAEDCLSVPGARAAGAA
ncbi:MAG: trehalose-6-phosphate synthase [Acidobacteria bacterium]|nr:trehalose-6-phosphate synthase [Acidobacteriota bacterium]MCU0253845.1 trehalose-6-phosphate synthase [Acidobacteriota bacterium]